MADEIDNHTLAYLRRLDEKLDRVIEHVVNLTMRVSSVEDQIVGLRTDFVRLEHRFDSLERRIERIERRLDLVAA